MKLALLSDVHGNLPALDAVLDRVEEISPDGLIMAGDLVGGPDFNEITQLLKELDTSMIVGNADIDFLKFNDGIFSDEKRASQQWGFMRWHSQHATIETVELLRKLPEQRVVSLQGFPPILVVHGSPRSPYESLFPDKNLDRLYKSLQSISQPVMVCGHSHVQWSKEIDGRLIVNPGAVGSPLQGDTHARFSILSYEDNNWIVEPKEVEYDVEKLRKRYLESGLLEAGGAVSKAFLITCETGHDVAQPFYRFALSKVKKQALGNDDFIPDDLWLEAEEEFPWDEYER